jgi:hypothetical protein
MTVRLFVEANARVVARRDLLAPDAHGRPVERSELQTAVASDTRNRRLAFEITLDERLDHVALELALEIQDVERKAQLFRHSPRVVNVVERAAARRHRLAVGVRCQPATLVPQLHREADKLVPRLLQHRGRRRAIDAAAHRHRNLHPLKTLLKSAADANSRPQMLR